jgi:hypothetical protein
MNIAHEMLSLRVNQLTRGIVNKWAPWDAPIKI